MRSGWRNAKPDREARSDPHPAARMNGSTKGSRLFFGGRQLGQFLDQQHMSLARVGAQHFEAQRADVERLALARHASKMIGDQSTDGVDILVGKVAAEFFIEL